MNFHLLNIFCCLSCLLLFPLLGFKGHLSLLDSFFSSRSKWKLRVLTLRTMPIMRTDSTIPLRVAAQRRLFFTKAGVGLSLSALLPTFVSAHISVHLSSHLPAFRALLFRSSFSCLPFRSSSCPSSCSSPALSALISVPFSSSFLCSLHFPSLLPAFLSVRESRVTDRKTLRFSNWLPFKPNLF